MPKFNENYFHLKESYLFSEISHRVSAYTEKNPDKKVIRLGIGDVTLPLGSEIISQLHEGVDALASTETFKVMAPNKDMNFCGLQLSIIIAKIMLRLILMKCLYRTVQKAILEILRTFLTKTILF